MKNGLVKRSSILPPVNPFSDVDDFFASMLNNFEDRFPLLNNSKLLKDSGRDYPVLNLSEDDSNYYVEAALPGWHKDEVNVNLDGDTLILEGSHTEKSDNSGRKYIERSISQRSFLKRVKLPNVLANKVEANLKDGLLSVKLPKNEPKKNVINVKVK